LDFYQTYHLTGGVQILQKAWDLLSDGVKAIFRIAESNLDALNTVDLESKRPFRVGECALWARLTGSQFAAQVAAVASLVEAPANHCKATTVAKEAMAIKLSNKTGLSIKNFLELPFPGKHLKPIQKGAKAVAAAEAAVAEPQPRQTGKKTSAWLLSSRPWAAAPLPWRSLRMLNPGTPYASAGSHTRGSACRRPARSIARKS
jgi:hypothetical protein